MCWKSTIAMVTNTTADMTTCYSFTATAMMKSTGQGVYDKDPHTEEPDEAKVSRPVREWQGGW